ncbi:hypothetical protein EJD97_023791 [Solanum chilense]|nr:hypothetical protein EJD97_023791 [Solanum chilense]
MLLWLCNPDHLVVLEHVVSNLLLMYLMRWSKFAYGMFYQLVRVPSLSICGSNCLKQCHMNADL